MPLDLSGLVICVTGAGRGIGEATRLKLTSLGASVVATDISFPNSLGDTDQSGLELEHDVTSPESWACVRQEIENRFGRLDALVNNAGIPLTGNLEGIALADWRRVQAVNVDGVLLGMQALLPLLRNGKARPGGASVVNISSVGGLRGVAFNAAYATSKGAVKLLTKSAALEFAYLGYPIRVNSVHPGGVETPLMDEIHDRLAELGKSSNPAKHSVNGYALGRLGKPNEIAEAIAFLCSSSSSLMTGAELVVDGARGVSSAITMS